MDPASHINYHAMRYAELADNPEMQVEAIARHYASHAQTAFHLAKILDMRRYQPDHDIVGTMRPADKDPITGEPRPCLIPSKTSVDEVIEYMLEGIRKDHLTDFGLPLEWPARGIDDGHWKERYEELNRYIQLRDLRP